MKALWILNSPIGTAAEVLGYPFASSGTWVRATEEQLKKQLPELEIHYAVLGSRDRVVTDQTKNCSVYELDLPKSRGKRTGKNAAEKWQKVLANASPDLIHVWGTEFTFPLDVMDQAKGIPVFVSIQGVIASIAKYVESDVPFRDLMKGHLFTALPAYVRAKQRDRELIRQVKFEAEIIKRASAILLDSEWEKAFYIEREPKHMICRLPLSINSVFSKISWKYEECEKNAIFSIAPSSSMKGCHRLLQALALVKKEIPDVKLRIPGSLDFGRRAFLVEPPYFRFLRRLIKDLDLENNVEFLGKLSSEEMAQQLRRANVFVMPSKIENQSTSLREAMCVGTPCVSSMVGIIHEFGVHKKNLLFYRYEEEEVLAQHVLTLLKDRDLAEKIGRAGKETARKTNPMDQGVVECALLYQKVNERDSYGQK